MALGRLRDVLVGAGYDEAGLERALTEDGRLSFAEGLAALRLRDDADEPAPLLARLFLTGQPVDADRLAAVLAPLTAGQLTDVLTIEDGRARARVKLEPFTSL